jgi:hypothetical protein
MACLT